MRRYLGPGLLLAAVLVHPFFALADTGGEATATLYVVASSQALAGGAGALGEGCLPPLVPVPPPLTVTQTVQLFHDLDGDGVLDPGDLLAYTAEIEGYSPHLLEGLQMIVFFSPQLLPEVLPGGWRRLDLGSISALVIDLPPLTVGNRARVGFAARFLGSEDLPPTLFVEGFVSDPSFVLGADDPTSATVLDPVAVAAREVAGGAASLFPGISQFSKRAFAASSLLGAGHITEKVGYEVTYIPMSFESEIELWDMVPAPLRVIADSLEGNTEMFRLGGLTLLRARFRDVSPGVPLHLKYTVTVSDSIMVPFVSTHAMAVTESGIFFSDDPATRETGDPTSILFPWNRVEGAITMWEEIMQKGGCFIPVIVRQEEVGEVLRWAFCGSSGSRAFPPGTLRFWILRFPARQLPIDAIVGFLSTPLSQSNQGTIYVPAVYGEPVFSALAGDVAFVEMLHEKICKGLYLPIVTEMPTEFPLDLTGVIANEDI